MITQEELDEFVAAFKNEDPALVNEALEECIKLFGRSDWNTMCSGSQQNAVWCWIHGWKKRDQALFTIPKAGWGGEWKAGETVIVPGRCQSEEEIVNGVEIDTVDDLIESLIEFRKTHNNLPVFHEDDCTHSEIEYFIIEPETDDDEILNTNLPRRLVIS
jgi:hypothetical protein